METEKDVGGRGGGGSIMGLLHVIGEWFCFMTKRGRRKWLVLCQLFLVEPRMSGRLLKNSIPLTTIVVKLIVLK